MTPRSLPATDDRGARLKAALQFVAVWAFALTISCAFWGVFVVLPIWWVNR